MASTLNLRAGANFLIFGRNFTHDGIHYNATLDFRNGDVLLDWFPFHGGFHVSGGALIYKYAQFWPIVAKTFGYRF